MKPIDTHLITCIHNTPMHVVVHISHL